MKNSQWSWANFSEVATAAVFLFIIFFPQIDQQLNLHLDKTPDSEKRTLSKEPKFSKDSLKNFALQYESYFNDNFSFRKFLVKVNTAFSAKAYDISAIPTIMIGQKGWLYYVDKTQGNSLEDFMGRIHLELTYLDLIVTKLDKLNLKSSNTGVKFVPFVAPDKQSVYPEYLPRNVRKIGRYRTRLNQVIDYVNKKSSVHIVNLGPLMTDIKENALFPTYKKTDTHWNFYGGFIAYQHLMKLMSIEPLKEKDFVWQQKLNSPSGDLAGMLGAADQFKEDNEIEVKPSTNEMIEWKEVETSYGKILKSKNENQSLPKVILFTDSFGPFLRPFISYHFRECIYITGRYSQAIIDIEKPDFVIIETVERYADQIFSQLPD